MHPCRFIPVLLLTILLTASSVLGKQQPPEFDADRNRLIAYVLNGKLPEQHFEHKPFDDLLSKAACELYLKQLDPRKQFLLQEDVRHIRSFAVKIDDEMRTGQIALPDVGMDVFNRRAGETERLVGQLLEAGFDPNKPDYLQINSDKQNYPADAAELKDRWRRFLKLEVLDAYLDEINKENKEKEKAGQPIQHTGAEQVDKKIWNAAAEKVRAKTLRHIDRLRKTSRQEHYNRYFDAVAKAFDPHTSYVDPKSKKDFDIHMRGSLEGIGALLREEDGNIKVAQVIPGSPAERQGQLQPEDIITAVSEKDGEPVDISAMSVEDAVEYIRGTKGTEVRLAVSRADGSRLIIPIVRDVVMLEETYVKSAVLASKHGQKIGYLKIPGFYRDFDSRNSRNVTDDTRSELLLLKKEGIKGLILDLRNNGGGSLSDAVDVSGLFLREGPVVQIKGTSGKSNEEELEVWYDKDSGIVYDGPMIVLVNQFSASASEILAGALQDYGRALIVGSAHTHGKGTVQTMQDLRSALQEMINRDFNRRLLRLPVELIQAVRTLFNPAEASERNDSLGSFKVTIQKFYRISGGSTQYKGIVPDVVLPSLFDHLETGEQYLDNSLSWDKVDTVPHALWRGPRIDPQKAVEKSRVYLNSSEKFKKIKQESLKAKQRKDNSLVPVFLAGVIKERKELERARKETKAAGVFDEEDEPGAEKKKKSLSEELSVDPYADIALFLFDN
jgi:carboxyl-terminal processing protease